MAFDTYLKLDGIDGESTDDKHKNWIEIYSFSWGMSNPSTVGSGTTGLTAGKVSISSFNVMKSTDGASVKLASHAAQGKHIKSMEVHCCATTGDKHNYVVYKMEPVMVDSIQWSGSSGGDDRPTESVSFSFGKVTYEYTPIGPDGKAGKKVGPEGWDLTKNVKA